MAMNEWKNIIMFYKLYKTTVHVLVCKVGRKTCFVISISAVILKLMVKITSIFGSYRFLRIAWHDIFLLSHHLLESWNLYIPRVAGPKNAHLLVKFNAWTSQRLLIWNPIPKLTIVLIWKTPAYLKCGKKIFHKEDSWVWAVNNACSHPPNLLVFLCELWHNAFW